MKSDTRKDEVSLLNDELKRERNARHQAEKLLEEKIQELTESNQHLTKVNETLERSMVRRTSTLTSVIKNLHAGILLEDENRRVILVNRKFCEMFHLEYSLEELVGHESSEIGISNLLTEGQESLDAKINEHMTNNRAFNGEVLKLKDGRVVELDFLPVQSPDACLGFMWQYRDITDQFHLEEKVRRSEEKYRGIIENMQLGLLEVSTAGEITRAYDSFCQLTGYSMEDLKGKEARLLYPENESFGESRSHSQRVYETQVRRKTGELLWMLVSESPYYDGDGNQAGTIGIHYNITHRKQLENDLREAREVAEQAREAEKQFLANMSHEIRNPINAIAGLINLLYDTKLSVEQVDYLDNIKYAADILLGLISDILDLSKIEAGKVDLEEKPVEVADCIRAVVQTFSFKTSDKDIQFHSRIDPRLEQPVMVAPTVLNQVLLNLLGNAVKFTEKGEIKVEAEVIDESADTLEISITISDTGIGISSSQLERIFDTFQQADKEIKLKYGGTGLGLSIVKQLLTFYNGSISVDSNLGRGSSFTFSMTLRKASELHEAKKQTFPISFSNAAVERVLVVEDNIINQKYLMGLLKKWKLQYDLAANGMEALTFLEENVYDVVLMDIRMPVMDGYEATIRIRNSDHNPNKDVPIIALTASALVDEKERAITAGMNYHLTKPFSPEQLLTVLNHIKPIMPEELSMSAGFQFLEDLDQAYLQEFYEDDLDRAALMFEIFLEHIHHEVAKLEDLYRENDLKGLAALAHRIKPNFSMVGLTRLSQTLQEVEVQAKGDHPSSLKEIVPFFITEFENKVKLVERQLASINSYISS